MVLAHALTAVGFDADNPPAGAGAARERWEVRNAVNDLYSGFVGSAGQMVADLEARRRAEHAPVQAGAVNVTTLHAAKGLEWDVVVIAGLTQGSLPIVYAKTFAQRQEEKRLLYVGVTRARQFLYCTWAQTHTLPKGRTIEVKRSAFLTELELPTPTMPKVVTGRVFESGQRVVHDRHGLGRVVTVAGPKVTVDFGSAGVRKINVTAPQLQPI